MWTGLALNTQRDSLKADLDDKYMVIFQNYGLDLEAVQKIYEKGKHTPPLVRNAPPVAGNIMWSRQLLRRIEAPMKKFSLNKSIMTTKESKRIVKTYNRVARALIEFEMLWHQARSPPLPQAAPQVPAPRAPYRAASVSSASLFADAAWACLRAASRRDRSGEVQRPVAAPAVLHWAPLVARNSRRTLASPAGGGRRSRARPKGSLGTAPWASKFKGL